MLRNFFTPLSEHGILGMNLRNIEYIARCNPRSVYPLVDDKLATKQLALSHSVAVPELYFVIERYHQVSELDDLLGDREDFALKPSAGSGGDGIIIITGRYRGRYRKASGALVSQAEMEDHITRILGGVYSLGGYPDKAIFEYRVRFATIFDQVSYLGVPDIRIIVFFGIPVMAMVRLPTRMSDGKANLHKGAVGAGIDIGRGRTLCGVWKNQVVDEHPDTGHPVSDIVIPEWDNLLSIASSCYDFTRLGYLGVDIVLDQDRGPLLLEMNARPGLSIQIANRAGLVHRLKLAEQEAGNLKTTSEKIAFAKSNFASK